MSVKNSITACAVSFTSVILLFLSFNLKGSFTLRSWDIEGLSLTYSVEHILLEALGRNRLSVSFGEIEENIESLPYVSSCSASAEGSVISVKGEKRDKSCVITDGGRWYFYSDGFYSLDRRDASVLMLDYLILKLDSDILDNALAYSFSRDERKMIDTLIEVRVSSNLITKAEYGNNNSSGYPLSLTLGLDSLSATLILPDAGDSDRLEEALSIIENEYAQNDEFFNSLGTEYVLSGGRLIETR